MEDVFVWNGRVADPPPAFVGSGPGMTERLDAPAIVVNEKDGNAGAGDSSDVVEWLRSRSSLEEA